MLTGAKQEELVALNLRRRDVWSVDDRLDANIEGFFDRVADGEGEVEGAREGVRRQVGDLRYRRGGAAVETARLSSASQDESGRRGGGGIGPTAATHPIQPSGTPA